MAIIEKYSARRINKDVAPDAVHPNGDRMFLPGDLLDALNCRYAARGSGKGKVKSVKGNTQRVNELPDGDNICIGRFLYSKAGTVIYCVYNSTTQHRVIEWNPDDNTFVTLLEGSYLGFTLSSYISQGGIIDDLFLWNNPETSICQINIVRARTGFYLGVNAEKQIRFGATPPLVPPTAEKIDDVALEINLVSQSNWQFAYNFIYLDNQESVFSPLSKLVEGKLQHDPLSTEENTIRVTVTIPSYLVGMIRAVQVAFREGNLGNYYIFNTIENPTDESYEIDFNNAGKQTPVVISQSSKMYDRVPRKTNGFEIVENRAFAVENSIGFSFTGVTFNLVATLGSEAATFIEEPNPDHRRIFDKRYLKDRGRYGVGIVFYDDFGRTSFVKSDKYLTVPEGSYFFEDVVDGSFHYVYWGKDYSTKRFITWALTGSPPSWASKYQIVLTKEQNYSVYGQALADLHFYNRELFEGADNSWIDQYSYNWRGKEFANPNEVLNIAGSRLYLHIPLNFPFTVEPGDIVKIFNPDWPDTTPTYSVQNVVGDFLDLGLHTMNNGISDPAIPLVLFFEVYRPSSVRTEIFYEIGQVFDVVAGAFSTISGRIDGDTTLLSLRSQTGQNLPKYFYENPPFSPSGPNEILPLVDSQDIQLIESPANLFRVSSTLLQNGSSGDQVILQPLSTLDYSRIDNDFGRPHTTKSNEREQNNFTTVVFSNVYVGNSDVNGLSSFDEANRYFIPIELGPVTALKKVRNVLLAIHQRNTSSLYVGEGFIRQGEDSIIAKTESVVGDDRQLGRSAGCINPESIFELDGSAYWWDAYRGEIVRYTNAGIHPISYFGMTDYFYQKSLLQYPYRNSVKIVTGYDFSLDEFLIHFPSIDGVTEAETWAFNVQLEAWVTRYSFNPDQIFSVSKKLITFKDGQIWVHGDNELYNNFYNQQYMRSFRFVSNSNLGSNKKFLNVHIDGQIRGEDESFIPARFYTKEGQESYTPAYEFEFDEGKWCGPILRDINTPGIDETRLPLRSGDEMVSNYIEVEIINDRADEAPCGQVNVVFKEEEFSK
jgi:hypothetical protein